MSATKFSLLLCSAMLALCACGGPEPGTDSNPSASSPMSPSPSSTESPRPSSSPTVTVSPATSSTSASPTAPASSSTPATANPTNQQPGAAHQTTAPPLTERKGYIPQGAVPVTSFYPVSENWNVGILVSPSGNIGCDVRGTTTAVCGVVSYAEERKYTEPSALLTRWIFSLDDSVQQVELGARGDALFFMMNQSNPSGGSAQVVPYGTSVYSQHLACESVQEAMTCWNTKTGRGVVMSREGYSTF